MKNLVLSAIFLSIVPALAQEINPKYDSVLAKRLGADDKGMKAYVAGIIKAGSSEIQNKVVRDSLVNEHVKHMTRLAVGGQLIAAGGLGKNENAYRGLFILNVTTLDQALSLMESDPAIKEKVFAVDFYKWTAPAALTESSKVHERLVKYKVKLN
jgi:uncharacterized protein